jgi:hypothetical protein
MAADMAVVIYGDESSVATLRALYPPNDNRLYRVKPIADFVTSGWSWEQDYALDVEKSVGHSIDLYKIWNEKIFFVKEVIESNPFATDAFAWVDIGCIRNQKSLWPMRGFPDPSKFPSEKVSFLSVQPFSTQDALRLELVDERFRGAVRLGGTIFAGGAAALLKMADIHYATIAEAKRSGVFAGKDQDLFAFEALRNPDLFNLISSQPRSGFDPWFQLLWRWASHPLIERQYMGHFFLQKLRVGNFTQPKIEFFNKLCAGKRVLHVGCTDYPIFQLSTNLHCKLEPTCAVLDGLDPDAEGLAKLRPHCSGALFTSVDQVRDEYDVVLVPEVLEHVADPAQFLGSIDGLRASQIVITAPCLIGHFKSGFFNYAGVPGRLGEFVKEYAEESVYVEEVHPDHNCWYSPYTLANSIQKMTRWEIAELWFLEGMSMVCAVCAKIG